MGMTQSERNKRWRERHPEKVKEANARTYARWRNDPDNWEVIKARSRAHGKEQRLQLRNAAIDFLGGRCVQCGFSDRRALQFDHVNGGGAKEYKAATSKQMYHYKVWQSILNGEGKFQLLCANCNWIKRHENGEILGT